MSAMRFVISSAQAVSESLGCITFQGFVLVTDSLAMVFGVKMACRRDPDVVIRNAREKHRQVIAASSLSTAMKESIIASMDFTPSDSSLDKDFEAIASDWRIIGNDMREAVKKYVKRI